MANYKVVNVVGVSKIGNDFDLNSLAMSLEGAEYEPEQFPGLILKLKEPKAAFLIFKSGKIVCTGTKAATEAQNALDILVSKLQKFNLDLLPSPTIEIVNMVASGDLGVTELNLTQLAMGLGLENIEYEPEQFPGMVFRMKSPKVVILIFSTGKAICTGAKDTVSIGLALDNLHKLLSELNFL